MYERSVARIFGGNKTLKHEIFTELDFADIIEEGIPYQAVHKFQKYSGINDLKMAEFMSITPKTFRRRNSRFNPTESNRAYVLAKITIEAEEAIGDKEGALNWLNEKQPALGGRIPYQLLSTSAGAQVVSELLGRINYGVYS